MLGLQGRAERASWVLVCLRLAAPSLVASDALVCSICNLRGAQWVIVDASHKQTTPPAPNGKLQIGAFASIAHGALRPRSVLAHAKTKEPRCDRSSSSSYG